MRVLLSEPGAFSRRLRQPSPGRHLYSGGRTCLPLSHMPNTNHEYPRHRHASSGDGRSSLPIWLEVDAEMHSEVEVEGGV